MTAPYCHVGPRRIAAALLLAGFPDSDVVLATMTAIHGAETSGDTWAVGGPNPNGSMDYGAFQINVPRGGKPPLGWSNYIDNAVLALPLYKLQGYYAWYGYKKIGSVAGFPGHGNMTWYEWGEAGVHTFRQLRKMGRSLEACASTYYPLDGVPGI